MSDNRTTELRRMLDERGVEYETDDGRFAKVTKWFALNGRLAVFAEYDSGELRFAMDSLSLTPEQAVAATLGDETPKKCSTCQYRYCVGQRPYPSFGYKCGFGDGKSLCGSNTSVLDHMCCEHWEKELR